MREGCGVGPQARGGGWRGLHRRARPGSLRPGLGAGALVRERGGEGMSAPVRLLARGETGVVGG